MFTSRFTKEQQRLTREQGKMAIGTGGCVPRTTTHELEGAAKAGWRVSSQS